MRVPSVAELNTQLPPSSTLTVVRYVPETYSYECHCTCGGSCFVALKSVNEIRTGHKRSCGCLRTPTIVRAAWAPHHLELFKSVTDGVLLGDGHIVKIKALTTSARRGTLLEIRQEDSRLGWLTQIADEYASLGVETKLYPLRGRMRASGYVERSSTKLSTRVYTDFAVERARWYPDNGHKRIPRDLALTPRCAAYWFCGDGCGDSRGYMSFATNGFAAEDVEFLQHLLQTTFGIRTTIRAGARSRPCRDGANLVIHVNRLNEARRFVDIIRPYVPACCTYKIASARSNPQRMRTSEAAVRVLRETGNSTLTCDDKYLLEQIAIRAGLRPGVNIIINLRRSPGDLVMETRPGRYNDRMYVFRLPAYAP